MTYVFTNFGPQLEEPVNLTVNNLRILGELLLSDNCDAASQCFVASAITAARPGFFNEGIGVGLYDTTSSDTLHVRFKSIKAGTGVTISDNGFGTVTINSSGGGGNGATNQLRLIETQTPTYTSTDIGIFVKPPIQLQLSMLTLSPKPVNNFDSVYLNKTVNNRIVYLISSQMSTFTYPAIVSFGPDGSRACIQFSDSDEWNVNAENNPFIINTPTDQGNGQLQFTPMFLDVEYFGGKYWFVYPYAIVGA